MEFENRLDDAIGEGDMSFKEKIGYNPGDLSCGNCAHFRKAPEGSFCLYELPKGEIPGSDRLVAAYGYCPHHSEMHHH